MIEFDSVFMKRLVLIDGHAIIHRAYHALPPLTTPFGAPAQAAYGFVSILLRVIDELKPTHLAVCFDLPEATFRHAAYIAYQAHRPTADQDLVNQIIMVHEVIGVSGIPVYTASGYEADDVLGTLAEQAVSLRTTDWARSDSGKKTSAVDDVVIVTGDKDIMQLVNDKKGKDGHGAVKVFAPIRGIANARLLSEKDVLEYVGIAPSKIVDYKALIGDSSDNYPGVPGIGPKTAVGLLEKFGTLEEIYRKLEEGKGKIEGVADSVCAKLVEGRESALMSQHLAKIVTDAPVTLNLERCELGLLREDKDFVEKLKELGFKSLLTRMGFVEEKSEKRKVTSNKKSKDQMELI